MKDKTKGFLVKHSPSLCALAIGVAYYLLRPHLPQQSISDKNGVIIVLGMLVILAPIARYVFLSIRSRGDGEKIGLEGRPPPVQKVWYGKRERILLVVMGIIFLAFAAATKGANTSISPPVASHNSGE